MDLFGANLSRSKKSFMPLETKCEKRKAENRRMSFDLEYVKKENSIYHRLENENKMSMVELGLLKEEQKGNINEFISERRTVIPLPVSHGRLLVYQWYGPHTGPLVYC
jgi:hypothetical protein